MDKKKIGVKGFTKPLHLESYNLVRDILSIEEGALQLKPFVYMLIHDPLLREFLSVLCTHT